jgi:hypothetical protein
VRDDQNAGRHGYLHGSTEGNIGTQARRRLRIIREAIGSVDLLFIPVGGAQLAVVPSAP